MKYQIKNKKNIVVGVCGAICAIDIYTYLYFLYHIFNIKVIMTENSKKFITKETLHLYCNEILDDIFVENGDVPHIRLAKTADCFLIFPASANIIGKISNGICDDLLSTMAMAYPNPIIFCPSMNQNMWKSKILQRNIEILKKDGHIFLNEKKNVLEIEDFSIAISECALPSPQNLTRYLYKRVYDDAV